MLSGSEYEALHAEVIIVPSWNLCVCTVMLRHVCILYLNVDAFQQKRGEIVTGELLMEDFCFYQDFRKSTQSFLHSYRKNHLRRSNMALSPLQTHYRNPSIGFLDSEWQ